MVSEELFHFFKFMSIKLFVAFDSFTYFYLDIMDI